MSQYIPGIVQYVPQVQPYRPDLNFYQKVLETKQAQYKAGYDQLSSLYGNLLESPMLRTENINLRNKFFNQITADIAKISSMDLSLPQNVEAASKIFQPLTDNKYILKDMAYTKQAYNQLKQADNFRNCTDEKKCGGKYWEGGVRAIQYQMQDFSRSGAEESLNFTAPRYTPYVNVAEKAMKFAKDMGFNMKTVSWSPDGRYQITTKNGTQMIPSLTNAFIATFQNDQAAVDYYTTKAYLSRKDFIASTVDQYGSEEAAENYYLDQMAKDLYITNDNLKKSSQKDIDLAKRNQAVAGQIIKSRGVDPNDPNDQKLAVSYNQSLVDEMIAASAADHYKQTADIVNPETVDIIDAQAKRIRIDAAVANGLFQSDLMNAARTYAELTVEQDITADPYALANHDYTLAIDRMEKQFGLDVRLENIKTVNKLLVDYYKNTNNPLGLSSNFESNSYSADPAGLGGKDVKADLKAIDEKQFQSVSSGMTFDLGSYMSSVNSELNQIANAKPGDYYGQVQVTDEMIKWAREKQIELFNGQNDILSTTTEVTTKKKGASALELISNLASGIPILGPMLNLAEVPGNKTKTVQVTQETNRGGLLDSNFNLSVEKVTNDPTFHDPKSKNNWFEINQRLNNFIENDPMGKILIGNKVSDVKARSDAAQKMYFANLEKMKHNLNGTKTALNSHGSIKDLVNDTNNPEYSLQQLNNIVQNGNFKTKEQFVKDYIAGGGGISQESLFGNTLESLWKLNAPTMFGGLANPVSEAETLYDKYADAFRQVYNQSKKAVTQFTDYKPLVAGYVKNASGAGIQSNPITIRNVDSAFPGDLGSKDFVSIYRNVQSAVSEGKDIMIFNTDGSMISKDLLEEGSNFNESPYKNALDLIYSHIQSGKTKKDKDRAKFDMTIHPIIGNDSNKVGFTIKLDQEFVEKNKGTKNKGITGDMTNNAITIVMNKEDATTDAIKRLNKGLYTNLVEAYGEVSLNGYPNGGNITIKPNQNGQGYNVFGSFKVLDPETGEFRDMLYNQPSNPYTNPDLIASEIIPVLKHLNDENYAAKEALRETKNLIKDPAQLIQ